MTLSDTKAMRTSHFTDRGVIGLVVLLASLALSGCGSSAQPTDAKPAFDAGEGAISGDIVGADHEPFDLELAGGKKQLKIELLSPALGVAATTYPSDGKPHFIFSHIAPGHYELTVYITIAGKRSIAGNLPVTVDPGQVAPAKLILTVTSADGAN